MRDYAALTHSGNLRGQNEDCFSADGDLGLWIVADGVGGHASGEVASKLACETIREQVRAGVALDKAIAAAHQRVLREISERQQNPGSETGANNMGSTVVVAHLHNTGRSQNAGRNQYQLAWAGDSRAYLWNGRLTQLTVDHSFVGELVAKGILTPEQAAQHPERHVITQSVGVSADMALQADTMQGQLQGHEQLLLCSDGLTDELSEAQIALELHRHKTPQQQAEGLLAAALAAGGRDNVTVIVIGAQQSAGHDPDVTQEIEPLAVNKSLNRNVNWRKWLAWLGVLAAVVLLLSW